MLCDAHCHYQFEELSAHWPQIARDLEAIGIGGAVVNGTHPDDWADVAKLAAAHSWVIPSYGIHPWDVATRPGDWQEKFTRQLGSDPRAHVGEIGLDRWILEPDRADDPMLGGVPPAPIEEQIEVFRWQLRWAAEHNRAASIHVLRAWGPVREVLRDTPLPPRGFLLHAYGGSPELVPEFVEMGAYFSYSTAHIDPRKTRQRKSFRAVPADRLLVETDAPAMAPPDPSHHLPGAKPGDSMQNHPANLALAYTDLAELREEPPAELISQVTANFSRLFDYILP
jgi:TatD DNase family protein